MIIFSSFLLQANSIKIKKSCEYYLRKIDDFEDGYRGNLKLLILENMASWKVEIEFTHKVFTLDVPQGDVKRSNGMNSFVITNRPYNGRLSKPGYFNLE